MHSKRKLSDIKFIYIFAVILVAHIVFSLKHIAVNIDNTLSHEEVHKIKIKLAPLDSLQDKVNQIVETEKSKLKLTDKASFLGKVKNTVDRQTIAKKVASFKKAGLGNSMTDQRNHSQSSASKKTKTEKKLSFSDLAVGNDWNKKSYKSAVKGIKNGDKRKTGLGSSNDFIKDIPLGDFTKLNTQEYEFYGFYHRIRQKLEQFWGRNIQEQAEKMFKSGRQIGSDRNLLTSLSIIINEKGEIVAVNINATSGVKELDQAAVKSFNEAGPFPNPPKKMLRNGVARIEWGFVVNT